MVRDETIRSCLYPIIVLSGLFVFLIDYCPIYGSMLCAPHPKTSKNVMWAFPKTDFYETMKIMHHSFKNDIILKKLLNSPQWRRSSAVEIHHTRASRQFRAQSTEIKTCVNIRISFFSFAD